MSKRGNREASIYQRSDGRWIGQIALPGDSRTKRRRKYVSGRTRDEVRRKVVKVQNLLLNGQSIPSEKETVEGFSRHWLKNIRTTIKFKTFETYESVVRNHINQHIGSIQLVRLKASHIQGMYLDLIHQGLSRSSVSKLHTVLHNMLEKAVRWDMLVRNVSDLVDVPRPIRRDKVVLSPTEASRFLRAARGTRLEALFTLAITTGARSGELLGLTWDNVNLDLGTVDIRQSLQKLETGYGLGEPKTQSSFRVIALSSIATKSLRTHRAIQAKQALGLGEEWANDLNLVFTSGFGTKLDSNNVLSRELRPLLKQAGLTTKLRFHDLRDIAASLLLATQPVTDVSEMLGHADPSITMKVYAHSLPGAPRRMADEMDRLLGA